MRRARWLPPPTKKWFWHAASRASARACAVLALLSRAGGARGRIAESATHAKFLLMADDRWRMATFVRGKSEHQTAACRAERAGAVSPKGAATESVTEKIRPNERRK